MQCFLVARSAFQKYQALRVIKEIVNKLTFISSESAKIVTIWPSIGQIEIVPTKLYLINSNPLTTCYSSYLRCNHHPCTHTHTHTCTRTRTHLHPYSPAPTLICFHSHLHPHTHAHAHAHAHSHAYSLDFNPLWSPVGHRISKFPNQRNHGFANSQN